MSKAYKNNIPIIYTSVLYILGLFLFLEWLYPVAEVTDTTNLNVFIIYALFCFIITLLQVNWLISFLLKGFGLVFIINGLFSDYSLFSSLWFDQMFFEIGINLQALLSQEWDDLSGLFRSILFLIIIWLMSYLIHYWFIQMKRLFIFVVLTFVYLAVLDTFTVYEANFSIIRTFVMAFVGLGMANFFKEIQMERITFSWAKKNPIWAVPLILIVLFSTAIGYAAPKLEPQWPDPVPFIQSATGGSGSGGVIQKVGYGEDDSRLGGSFVQDDTPVFQAAAKEQHYWRIESKDVYTGKGWEGDLEQRYIVERSGEVSWETYGDSVEAERLEAIIDFQGNTNISKLVYPYGVTKVETDEYVEYHIEENSGEIRTLWGSEDIALTDYTILYDYPTYPLDKMREDLEIESQELKQRYTQLPSSLPERVGELAQEITAGFTTQYDQVKAIESYFGRNGFVYQTTDVPVPGGEQDYVDQFLFDSQVGYCDNFSTSMVVMLRTLDIPARWVKGFTSGEKISDYVGGDTSYDVYEVTNSNAHSWVEVYFPEVGWVPFEPTQGFNNLVDFYSDADSETGDDTLEAPTPELEESEEPDPILPEEEETVEAMNPGNSDDGSSNNISINWWYVLAAAGVFTLIAIVLYIKRFHWQSYLLDQKWNRKQDQETYQDAYHFVLKLLKHQGFLKEPDQTLREYAKRIDTWYSTDSMARLTGEYEKIIYKNDQNTNTMTEMKDLWKNLIKQILG